MGRFLLFPAQATEPTSLFSPSPARAASPFSPAQRNGRPSRAVFFLARPRRPLAGRPAGRAPHPRRPALTHPSPPFCIYFLAWRITTGKFASPDLRPPPPPLRRRPPGTAVKPHGRLAERAPSTVEELRGTSPQYRTEPTPLSPGAVGLNSAASMVGSRRVSPSSLRL